MSLKETLPGKLFVFSGPSGAGKGTICKRILAEMPKMSFSVSMATREPRKGEVDGKDYFFVSKEEFEEGIKEGKLLEYAEVYGNYYGTPKEAVKEKLAKGIDVILDIDIQGALNVKRNYPDAICIFILPPSMAELRKRLTGRGSETEESLERRLGQTLNELTFIEKYDYCVVNGELDEAVMRVKSIVTAEHSRVAFSAEQLIESYKKEDTKCYIQQSTR